MIFFPIRLSVHLAPDVGLFFLNYIVVNQGTTYLVHLFPDSELCCVYPSVYLCFDETGIII